MRALLVAGLLLLPVAGAQMPDPPHLSTEDMVLYAHVGPAKWLNTVQDDPDHNGETATIKFTEAAAENALTWTLTPGLAETVTLDGSGTIDFRLGFGCGLVAHAGILEVTLRHGSDVVAEHEFAPSVCPVTHLPDEISYSEYTASVTPAITTLSPGADLTWEVKFTGVGAAFMQTGQGGSYSFVTLPVIGPVPRVEAEVPATADGPVFGTPLTGAGQVTVQATNTSSQSHVTNWTNSFTNVTLSGDFTGSGNVTVSLIDETNTTVFQQKLAGNGTVQGNLTSVAPGNWTIVVDLDGVQGTLTLNLAETAAGGPGVNNATTDATTNATTEAPAADSPGFEVVALLALLAVAGLLRRRR